ncbi:PucR family transcriptional regulator [Gulosibacter bifidus]|uniref:PucR family transcriptional regulator n=1 Tax=Gulosibacter bifidus TaxID=272239 RepID=A0ABW5RJP9_9MICO|nr:PucR family transcriptional regulator [Gulosibacter bifidus]
MPVTLRTLLDHAELGLRLHPSLVELASRAGGIAQALDSELTWVHSSDLVDPTPWLRAGQVLLTDGSQFADAETSRDVDFARAYVDRLANTGVVGLGFAVGVVLDRIPEALVAACVEAELPIFIVPTAMPFLRISRHVADVANADRTARLTWLIDAHRAIANATLKPDGLGATLRELEVQLGCWVALYDRLGRRIRVRTRFSVPDDIVAELDAAVQDPISRGRPAATRFVAGTHEVTLQTIGQRGNLRGVLAVGTSAPLDHAGNDLLASVIGIASIAVEQERALDQSRSMLRRGVLELVLAGATKPALEAMKSLGSWLPDGDVCAAIVTDGGGQSVRSTMLSELELRAEGEPFTFAPLDDEVLLVWGDEEPTATLEYLQHLGCRIGVSEPVAVGRLRTALDEARRALQRANLAGERVDFASLCSSGLVGWLAESDAQSQAAHLLAPLRAREDADTLLAAARAWFTHNCAWDPAARDLDIHRHTLRARIDTVAEVVELNLEQFSDRAQLWAALQLLEVRPRQN